MHVELDRLWLATLRCYGGHYGDVNPRDVITWLLTEAPPPLKSLIRVCLERKVKLKTALADLHAKIKVRARLGHDNPNYYKVIYEWPIALWKAFRQAVKYQNALEITVGLGTPLGIEPGLALDVCELYDDLIYGDKAKRNVTFSKIDTMAGMIDLVIRRLPAHFESYVRSLNYALILNPKLYPVKLAKGEGKVKLDPKVSAELHRVQKRFKLRLGLMTNPQDYKGSPGMFKPSTRTIYLQSSIDELVIAHEVGHAIWELAYDSEWLYAFLLANLSDAAARVNSIDDFALAVQRGLQGVHLDWAEGRNDRRTEMLDIVTKLWGESYVDRNSAEINKTYKGGSMVQLRQLLKRQDSAHKIVDELILDDKANRFLVAWDEHWAEGFVRVLLGQKPEIPIPGVIITLIHRLLQI